MPLPHSVDVHGGQFARLVLCVAATLLFSGEPSRVGRVKDDLAVLQGTWVLKTAEYLGERTDQDPEEDELCRKRALRGRLDDTRESRADFGEDRTTLTIRGNAFTWRSPPVAAFGGGFNEVEPTRGTLTLDGSRKPRVLTRQLVEPTSAGEKTVYATYSVEGNTLRLGMFFSNDPKRLPTRFVTDKDEDVVVLTFKRENG
jgi:uncharacterized protein (TIGR03067 family)